MIVTAKLRHLHIAPRKVRLVADLVRGKSAQDAQSILDFTTKKAAKPLLKLLNSAIANAKNNFQLDYLNLYISKITVDGGPILKRWRARARGSANEIQKKTSHVNLVLEEIAKSKRVKKAKEVKEAAAEVSEAESAEKEGYFKKEEKPKLKPEAEIKKPKIERGMKRVFRRKAF